MKRGEESKGDGMGWEGMGWDGGFVGWWGGGLGEEERGRVWGQGGVGCEARKWGLKAPVRDDGLGLFGLVYLYPREV